MRMLPRGARNVSVLLDETQTDNLAVTMQQKALMFAAAFEDLPIIHQRLLVEDLSANNLMFLINKDLLDLFWIDFESWKVLGKNFGEGYTFTPDFVDPLFVDPETNKVITQPSADNDIYSLMLQTFVALTYVYPYSGAHKSMHHESERKAQGVWVGDASVKAPAFGLPLEVLSDELLHAFALCFTHKERGYLDSNVLRDYSHSLVECPTCGVEYHNSRRQCPECQEVSAFRMPTMAVMIKLVETRGAIQSVLFRNNILHVIANEGKVTHYLRETGDKKKTIRKVFDPSFAPGMQFEVVGDDIVAIGDPDTEVISLIDIGTGKSVTNTTSAEFLPSGKLAFRGAPNGLIRVVGDTMQRYARHETFSKKWVDNPLPVDALRNQTWLWQDPNDRRQFVIFNYHQTQFFFVVDQGMGYKIDLPQVDIGGGERIDDMTVRFGSESLIVRRQTKKGNANFIRTDIVRFGRHPNERPEIVNLPTVPASSQPHPVIRKFAYGDSGGRYTVWHPTDQGILTENLVTGEFGMVEKSDGVVNGQDRLIHVGTAKTFGEHFLVQRRKNVFYLVFK